MSLSSKISQLRKQKCSSDYKKMVDRGIIKCKKRKLEESSLSGKLCIREMMRLLDSFGLKRSEVQKNLHLGMIGSILQKAFEFESDAEMRDCMQEHAIKSSKQQFMAITPRRFGKTTAVSMFVASFALSVPGSVTAIFSTGRRASNLLLQQIKNMLLAIPGVSGKIVSANVETIVLEVEGQHSKISSFPGKAKT